MGHMWQDAPVYCVLVQVRFNPILKLGSFVGAIQDSLRHAGGGCVPHHNRLPKIVIC